MIESYAVFEGGGAKGAAFAGALKAAEESKIKFVGYGGASAGAIIAFLSSLGMSADEIYLAMQIDKFPTLLDSNRSKYTDFIKYFFSKRNYYKRAVLAAEIKLSRTIDSKRKTQLYLKRADLIDKKTLLYTSPSTIFNFIRCALVVALNKGFHDKKNIVGFLVKYSELKIRGARTLIKNIDGVKSLTFNDFYNYSGIDFRVIATDVKTGSVVEFSWDKTPNDCIFQAIAASCSYPLFFKPSFLKEHVLVDGGVSCNLPTFLFNGPKYKNLPVYAFDLSSDGFSKKSYEKYGFMKYMSDLTHSAIDASNNIISNVVGGIAVPVKVPAKYSTLNFNLNEDDINRIYLSGYDSASDFFIEHHLTRGMSKTRTIYDEAKNLCGDFDYFLSMIREQIESTLLNARVKIWLYVSIDSKSSQIVTVSNSCDKKSTIKHHSYFIDSNSINNINCVEAWHGNMVKWTYDSKKNITRFCFPVMKFNSFEKKYAEMVKGDSNQVVALICIDVNIFYQNCTLLYRWNYVMKGSMDAFKIDPSFQNVINAYTLTIRNVLIGERTLFHETKII